MTSSRTNTSIQANRITSKTALRKTISPRAIIDRCTSNLPKTVKTTKKEPIKTSSSRKKVVEIDLNRTIKTTNETKTIMANQMATKTIKKPIRKVARTITSAMLTRKEVRKITIRQISKTLMPLAREPKKPTTKRVKVVVAHSRLLMIKTTKIRRMLRSLKSNRKISNSSSPSIKSSRKKKEEIRTTTMGIASKVVEVTSRIEEVIMDSQHRVSTRRNTIREGRKMARSRCSSLRTNQPKLLPLLRLLNRVKHHL